MTAITYVTPKQMERKTGLKHALGYSLPEEDKILIRKGLSKEKKKEVLAHEEDHIAKGEEGPFWQTVLQYLPQILQAGSSLYSSSQGKKAGKDAKKGSQRELDLIRESRDIVRADTRHTRQAGATALNALMRLTGLSGPGGGVQYDEQGWPVENAGGAMMPQETPVAPLPKHAPGGPPKEFPLGPDARPIMRSAYQARYSGGPTNRRTIYNVNELGPESRFSGGVMRRNPNPMTIDGETGYIEPNIEGRGLGGLIPPGTVGTEYDPVFGGPKDKPRRGSLPNTDWTYNDKGRIAATGYGHWNRDLGQYVDRRGRPKKNQAAPPEGWQDPATQTDIDTTQGLDYNFQTDPGYQFRFGEGMRALDRSAAARGGLLSGGFARKAIRYGQGFASNEYTNVYNRIANIAGMGQVANQFAGNATMQGGMGMGAAAGAAGINSAYGRIASGNALSGGLNQMAQMWGGTSNNNGYVSEIPYADYGVPRRPGSF